MDIISYLKEYIRITLAIIKTPQAFFEGMKGEGKGYLKQFVYLFATCLVSTIGGFLGFFPLYASSSSELTLNIVLIGLFIGFSGFFINLFFLTPFLLISTALMHFSVRIVGGKGTFNDTFKVMCYALAPLNFVWVFMVPMTAAIVAKSTIFFLIAFVFMLPLFFSMLYILYIVIVGISVTSVMTRSRALFAVLIQISIFFVIYMVLIFAILFFIGSNSGYHPDYSTNTYPAIEPPVYQNWPTTIVYSGSTPQIDGIIDERDNWDEVGKTHVSAGEKDYTFAAKHNFEYIYILIEWEDPPERNDEIELYFEQDGRVQDFNLRTGVVDNYYQGNYNKGPESFLDAHYQDGYTLDESQNGNMRSTYKDRVWILEWQIPMNSGDKDDINIRSYPVQIGFAIANHKDGAGIYPQDADIYEPLTWGNMSIVDKKKN